MARVYAVAHLAARRWRPLYAPSLSGTALIVMSALVLAACTTQATPTTSTVKTTSPGVALTGSRHTNPLQLVGVWHVTDTGERQAPVASLGNLGLLLWQSCGWVSGSWNANQQGLFVGNLTGGDRACMFATDLNPKWLATATAYKAAGRDELILGPTGGVLARLVPTIVPRVLRKGMLPAYTHPVITSQLRKVLLQVNRPLPSGLVPATGKQLVGQWVPASLRVGHWHQTPYLTFTPNGNWSGSDGCNGLGGRWSMGSGGSLVVVESPSTLIGCNNVNVEWWLFRAARAAFRGPTLLFVDASGSVTSRLRRG